MPQRKINEDKDHFSNNTYTSQLWEVERDRKLLIIAKT